MGDALRKANEAAWATKSALLEKAFSKLPRQQRIAAGIPYARLIPGIARELLLMTPSRARQFRIPVVVSEQDPAPIPVQAASTRRKSLWKVAQSARATVEALDSLPPAALDMLKDRQVPLREFQAALLDLKIKLRMLHATAEKAAKLKGRRGRPPNRRRSQVAKIRDAIEQHYEVLTGRRPTRYDKTLAALKAEVFKVLGVARATK